MTEKTIENVVAKQQPSIDPTLWGKLPESEKDEKSLSHVSLTYWQDVWRRLRGNKGALFGLIIILALILFALVGPLLTNHTYDNQNLSTSNIPPRYDIYKVGEEYLYLHKNMKLYLTKSNGEIIRVLEKDKEDMIKKQLIYTVGNGTAIIDYSTKNTLVLTDENGKVFGEHKNVSNKTNLLGTDHLGRDLLTRIMYGARVSLLVAVVAALVNFLIGMMYGGIAGFFGGKVDNIMMRIVDIISIIPLTLYVILIMVVLNSGLLSIIIALGSVYWVDMARVVRGQMLSLKEEEFVYAAKTIGTKPLKIITTHLLPNAMGAIIVTLTMLIPSAIFMEAFMSFIGLGVTAPMASWGTLCNEALESIRSFSYQLFFPAIAICITMIAFNLIGDGLRDALDPKLRK
ncbi:ABC transporter permease [Sporosarcina limicola]|uniref:Oligopeptide transport system permease protein n=1 Tax=Sporosarcina limicola TaxID=34101 RepID=A0A927MJZ3_9BACL|nr:ABC transporter permease [Sporosarcina limicola]MBE1552969.1 oligopeptide transport system permease protein [Sporosarcina limicola]